MCVYYFRCYWPSNLLFVVTCVTYIPNLIKIGQKLCVLLWTNSIADRHTDRNIHSMSCIALERRQRVWHWMRHCIHFVHETFDVHNKITMPQFYCATLYIIYKAQCTLLHVDNKYTSVQMRVSVQSRNQQNWHNNNKRGTAVINTYTNNSVI